MHTINPVKALYRSDIADHFFQEQNILHMKGVPSVGLTPSSPQVPSRYLLHTWRGILGMHERSIGSNKYMFYHSCPVAQVVKSFVKINTPCSSPFPSSDRRTIQHAATFNFRGICIHFSISLKPTERISVEDMNLIEVYSQNGIKGTPVSRRMAGYIHTGDMHVSHVITQR